jgi:ketosteroid isomerase-like protein
VRVSGSERADGALRGRRHARAGIRPLVRGRDAIRASLADFLANPSHFTLRLEQVVETDDIALLVSSWTLTGTTPDGDAIELCGRTSDVVRRQRDGTWRLVIDHPYGGVPTHTTESAA